MSTLSTRYRLFASCGADELSYEDPLGTQAGVFSYYLAEGLGGQADADQDGVVRLDELIAYVGAAVQSWCRQNLELNDLPQRPRCLPDRWRDSLPLAFDPLRTRAVAYETAGQYDAAVSTLFASPAAFLNSSHNGLLCPECPIAYTKSFVEASPPTPAPTVPIAFARRFR